MYNLHLTCVLFFNVFVREMFEHLRGTHFLFQQFTLQSLHGLQPGQQGHLLLKTENGQYQLLRVGPAPTGPGLVAAQPATVRMQTLPAVSLLVLAFRCWNYNV